MGTGGDNRGLYGKSLADIVTAALGSPPYPADAYIDYMKATGNTILGLTKEIDHTDSPYTISDIDGISTLIVDTGTSDVTVNLPTLADNFGRRIKIINADGSNDVIVVPEGTEKINSYNANVLITEKWGWWEFLGSTSQWNGTTDGFSTKVETTSNSNHTMSTSEIWQDSDLTISIDEGRWRLNLEICVFVQDTSDGTYIRTFCGLGTTSGNNEPEIQGSYHLSYTSTNESYGHGHPYHFDEIYENSASSKTIYIKCKPDSQNGTPTTFSTVGNSYMTRRLTAWRIK